MHAFMLFEFLRNYEELKMCYAKKKYCTTCDRALFGNINAVFASKTENLKDNRMMVE